MIDLLFYLPQILALFCALWFINVWIRCFRCCRFCFKKIISVSLNLFYIACAFCFLFIDVAKKTIDYISDHSSMFIHG